MSWLKKLSSLKRLAKKELGQLPGMVRKLEVEAKQIEKKAVSIGKAVLSKAAKEGGVLLTRARATRAAGVIGKAVKVGRLTSPTGVALTVAATAAPYAYEKWKERQRVKKSKELAEKAKRGEVPMDVAFVRETQLRKRRTEDHIPPGALEKKLEELRRKDKEEKKKKMRETAATEQQQISPKKLNVEAACIEKVKGTVQRHLSKPKTTEIVYQGKRYRVYIDYPKIIEPIIPLGTKIKPSRNIEAIKRGWVVEGVEKIYIRCQDNGMYYEVRIPARAEEIVEQPTAAQPAAQPGAAPSYAGTEEPYEPLQPAEEYFYEPGAPAPGVPTVEAPEFKPEKEEEERFPWLLMGALALAFAMSKKGSRKAESYGVADVIRKKS